MESFQVLSFLFLLLLPVTIRGWGIDGHFATCKIAQGRLSQAATDAVRRLLPDYAQGDLASLCSWADHVKFRYHWSSALHYIDTPDNLCTYQYNRDCKDENGVLGNCVAGALNNYTTQLLDYGKQTSQYNLTEALLFLSHFMGDIHQPLHVGFTSDRGGNSINVHWFTRKAVLHHVGIEFNGLPPKNEIPPNKEMFTFKWNPIPFILTTKHANGMELNSNSVWDDSIIETEEERFYGSEVETYVDAIQTNITKEWADQVPTWEKCSRNMKTCPNIYASEGIKAACDWAYKGVGNDSVLGDEYFMSRLPIVNWRLAQGGVRLAATLNRIFV